MGPAPARALSLPSSSARAALGVWWVESPFVWSPALASLGFSAREPQEAAWYKETVEGGDPPKEALLLWVTGLSTPFRCHGEEVKPSGSVCCENRVRLWMCNGDPSSHALSLHSPVGRQSRHSGKSQA